MGRALRSPRGNRRPWRRQAGRAPLAPLAPLLRPSACPRAHAHTLGQFPRFSRGSQKLGASAGGESRRRLQGARSRPDPPTAPPQPPQAPGPPEAGLGAAPSCAAGGVSLLLLKDERRHGRLCRFSRTVAAAAAASLHIQVENFQESAETLCPKKTESQLPPNPGGDSPWKTSLR